MKKAFAFLLLSLFMAPQAQANKPIFLGRVQSDRSENCNRKFYVEMSGARYALSRLEGMYYTLPDGTMVTDKDPVHPYNNCGITDVGKVSGFSTGYMKSGLSLQVETVPADKQDAFLSTYTERKVPIQESMSRQNFEFVEDGTIKISFKTSVMYLLPKDIVKTDNGERVAVYCKFPAGVNIEDEAKLRASKRVCSTRYLHPNGLGFGYSFVEGKDDKHILIDLTARKVLEKLIMKPTKQAPPTP